MPRHIYQWKKSIINEINSNQKQLIDWNGRFNETQKGLKGMLSLDQQASVLHLKLLTLMVLLPTQVYTCKWLSSLFTLHRLFQSLGLWASTKGEQGKYENDKDLGKKHRRSQQVAQNPLPFCSCIICTNWFMPHWLNTWDMVPNTMRTQQEQ